MGVSPIATSNAVEWTDRLRGLVALIKREKFWPHNNGRVPHPRSVVDESLPADCGVMDQVSWWRNLTKQISQAKHNNISNNPNKPAATTSTTVNSKPPPPLLSRVSPAIALATAANNASKVSQQRGMNWLGTKRIAPR